MSDTNNISTSNEMYACTVRFSRETAETMREIATDNSVSYASIVRYAALGGLEKYLGNIKYIDKEHAQVINENICTVANLVQECSHELKKIGVNYNQQVKHQHIKEKSYTSNMSSSYTLDDIIDRANEKKKNEELTHEMINQVNDIVSRFEIAAGKLGESLWHIQE